MSSTLNVSKIEEEIECAICYFEKVPYIERVDESIQDDFKQFFNSIKNTPNLEKFDEIEKKYGMLLKYYREQINTSNIETIKDISKFFLIITILSIVVGIIASIVVATS